MKIEFPERKRTVALVRGEGFRCSAFRDHTGNWRGIYSDRELPPVLEVLSEVEQPENMPLHIFRL